MLCFVLLTARKQTYETKFAWITLLIEFLTESNYNKRNLMDRVVLGKISTIGKHLNLALAVQDRVQESPLDTLLPPSFVNLLIS